MSLALCFRTCFKLEQKSYVDFCLQRKCGGVDFNQAARTLGLVNQTQATDAHNAHAGHHWKH